ncbi:carbohydrate sulfotransferase 11-like [Ostrinia nubilalis]|uniref:carbohydrate sulfotransferase 11-like n=1 Tax=Ostrinia nubilalis TaxID=29057 RepID=UPI00103E7978|nr:carbohydrate sulfotransferase 11-like isoform X2 [Ostrinia furnacalis]
MVFSVKRFRTRLKTKGFYYLRCGAKTATFVFWAALYMAVMKMTIFKTSVNTPIVREPDNYTKWLGPVLGDDETDTEVSEEEWAEPDNATIVELEKRKDRVKNVCRLHAINTKVINSKEFLVDHVHSLVWCNIFKAASTYWLYKFNILGGYDRKFLAKTRKMPLILARKKFPRPSEEELRDAINTPGVISLIVVRDPFVRLLSAYRDKLEHYTPPFYRKLAGTIVAEHRDKATKIFGPIKSIGPTFYEFIAYLTSKKNRMNFDEHWKPYYQFCTPCGVNFSVVAKVETLSRDSAYVIQQLGLGPVLGKKVSDEKTRLRIYLNKSKDGRNTTALLKHYYSQIDNKMLDDLLKIYGLDFEMFGYDAKVYRTYVRK